MLKRFLVYYKSHGWMLAADMGASLMISVIGLVYPIINNNMLNDYIPNHRIRAVVWGGILLMALYVLRYALRYFVQYQGHMIGISMQAQMRRDLFNHLQKLPCRSVDDHETGKIMTRMTSDLFEVCELAHHGPENLLISSVMIILSFL